MPSTRRASILKLAFSAQEMDLEVLRGRLESTEDGHNLSMDGRDLLAWLSKFKGQEIVILAASMEDERPMPVRTCGTCGRDYTEAECPHCRDVRRRLRDRA